MFYGKFALILLSVFGVANSALTSSVSTKCKYTYDDEVINNTIKGIAVDLNITECQAGQIYNFVIKGNSIFDDAFSTSVEGEKSIKQCKTECRTALIEFKDFINEKENQKLMKVLGENVDFLNFLTKCQKDCDSLPEMLEDRRRYRKKFGGKKIGGKKKERKFGRRRKDRRRKGNLENISYSRSTLNNGELEKREVTCDAIENSRINLIENNFQYGVPRFQQALNSVETAIIQVNGCGPKLFDKYDIGESYNGLFLPACNSHDVCYDCQNGKATCDDSFLNNMEKLCDSKYNTDRWIDKILHAQCYVNAKIFYKAVDLFGNNSYERCGSDFNSNPSCAFCGNNVVSNFLINSAFYIKKDE